jgi:hypothetical protein
VSTGLRTLAVVLAIASGASCSRPATPFSVKNARAHVNQLAGAIGPRPVGTDANRRAREYLIEQLRLYGFTVRVQEVDAVRPEFGLTAHVQNIIAVVPGAIPDAVGLVAHYDSVATAPGAGDDAFGVAVSLEVGRQLAARRSPRHSVMVLLTDAEENGLMGAAALVTDPEVKARLRAYVNFDSAGLEAPVPVFQTGPGNAWLVRAFASAAPAPRGNSMSYEVYSRLPNDTDFTILQRLGAPGLNLGPIGESYAYHTARDEAERLPDDVLEQAGSNVLATLQALDGANLSARTPEQAVYFDVLSRRAFVVSPLANAVLGWFAIAVGVAGWLRVLVASWRAVGFGGLLRTALWALVTAGIVALAVVGAAALLRAVREVYHPWYAHPGRFWLLLALTSATATHVLMEIWRRLPLRWQPERYAAVAWAVTLPAWLVLATVVQATAPGAAFLWTIPVAVAGVATLALGGFGGVLARLAALVVLAASVAIWVQDAVGLLAFSVPLLGRMPFVTPIAALPAAFLATVLMAVPPLAAWAAAGRPPAALPRSGRPGLSSGAFGLALTLAFAWAYVADAYTRERPQWRSALYVADHASGRAAWEVGGLEPGLDVHADAGAPRDWHPAPAGPLVPGAFPARGTGAPFAFRATAAPAQAPVAATGAVSREGGEVRVQVRAAVSQAGATLLVVLPPGVTPLRASLAGTVRDGRWVAAYAGVPPGTTIVTAVFRASDEAALAGIRAGLRTDRLPGAAGPAVVPAWMPAERATWNARAVELVPVSWVAPDAPLR